MAQWSYLPAFRPRGTASLPLQLAEHILQDIRSGRLRPGDALPSSRALAEALELGRNTVSEAYRELALGGWIQVRPAGGTSVADPLPEGDGAARPAATPAPAVRRGDLVAHSGLPDQRLQPSVVLARAYRRALQRLERDPVHLPDPQGLPALREGLAELLRRGRGYAVDPSQILVLPSLQFATFLVIQALVKPGDRVACEALGAPAVRQAILRAGGILVPLPVDSQGADVEALEQELRARPVKAVFLTPRCQYPTTAVLTPERRAHLKRLAQRTPFWILEQDPDGEIQYGGAPIPSLAAEDPSLEVVHLGVLSKLFAGNRRLGYLAAPAKLLGELRALRQLMDQHGDPALEGALAELLAEGSLRSHLLRMRETSQVRRDTLVAALQAELGEVLRPVVPQGGMALWVPVDPKVDLEAWRRRAEAQRAVFTPGREFHWDGQAVAALRLGFAAHEPAELQELARRLRTALP